MGFNLWACPGAELLTHLSNKQGTLTWGGIWATRVDSVFASQRRVPTRCLQWRKNVDYLLIAKPVAINHLRIRHDCADILWMLCRLCVVLSEGHDRCCFYSDREKCVWNLWDRGTRCFICRLWFASTAMECISTSHLNLQLLMTNSHLWKRFSNHE